MEVFRSDLKTGDVVKLNGPLVTGGDAGIAGKDPKGRYAYYSADQDADGEHDLYRTDLKTGKVLKLSGPMTTDGDVLYPFVIDAKGRYVIYLADQETNDQFELF